MIHLFFGPDLVTELQLYYLFPVLKECKQLGIQTDKVQIESQIQRVMDFFFLAKSFRGKLLTKKSSAKIVPRKADSTPSELMMNINQFSDGRGEDSPMVISCDHAALSDIVDATTEPCLVVPSSDLNFSSFGKQLGNFLLEDQFHLFFETSGLSNQGKERLQRVIQDMIILFDNRIRIILYGSSSLEELSEKRFEKQDLWSSVVTPKSSKRQKVSPENASPVTQESCFSVELVTQKSKNELAAMLKEKTASDLKVQELEKKVIDMKKEHMDEMKQLVCEYRNKESARAADIEQRVELQFSMKVQELEEKSMKAMEEVRLLTEQLESLKKHNISVSNDLKQSGIDREDAVREQRKAEDKVEKLSGQNKLLEKKISALEKVCQDAVTQTEMAPTIGIRTVSMINNSCQTRSVDVQLSPISLILKKIEDSGSYCTSARVSSSIKNFAYSVCNIPDQNGVYKCKIKITNGAQIMSYQNLLQFEGSGENMSKAKEDAFEALIQLMRAEAEK